MANSAVRSASAEIDIDDSKEIRYWCRKLRCRQSDLIAAVVVLGPAVAGVEKYLRRRAVIAKERSQ